MAYLITFSESELSGCFFAAGVWLRLSAQGGVNVLALTVELELEDDEAGVPEIHHVTLCYTDGDEPADAEALANYRAQYERQL